jgi:hypothetical protein
MVFEIFDCSEGFSFIPLTFPKPISMNSKDPKHFVMITRKNVILSDTIFFTLDYMESIVTHFYFFASFLHENSIFMQRQKLKKYAKPQGKEKVFCIGR